MKMINKIPSSKYVLLFCNLLIQHLFTNYALIMGLIYSSLTHYAFNILNLNDNLQNKFKIIRFDKLLSFDTCITNTYSGNMKVAFRYHLN